MKTKKQVIKALIRIASFLGANGIHLYMKLTKQSIAKCKYCPKLTLTINETAFETANVTDKRGWRGCFNLLWKWQRLTMLKGFWRIRDAQLVSIKSLMPTHLKILPCYCIQTAGGYTTTPDSWDTETTKLWVQDLHSDQTPSQTCRTPLPLWKLLKENIYFSPLCFIPLNERLRRYQVMKPPEQKAQVLGVLTPW